MFTSSPDFSTLVVGNKVIVVDSHIMADTERVATVSHVTATMLTVEGRRFRKDGSLVGGDSWSRTGIAPWSAEREEAIRQKTIRRNNIRLIQNTKLDGLDDATLAAMVALLGK